jgi:hypothetical protein
MLFNFFNKLKTSFSDAMQMGDRLHIGEQIRDSIYTFECRRADGTLRWAEERHNLVTTVGATDSLDKQFKGSSYTAGWFVGLTNTTPTFATGDTASSHGGWTEFTSYSGGARSTLTLGTASAGSVSNSASPCVFTFTGSGTVGGAFVISNSTLSGTTGVLYGGATLSANRPVFSDDTLTITVTLTAS